MLTHILSITLPGNHKGSLTMLSESRQAQKKNAMSRHMELGKINVYKHITQ